MTPTVAGLNPETCVALQDVSWNTYVRLNDETRGPGVRLTYYQGFLEIMTVSNSHEGANRLISDLFACLAEGLGIDNRNMGGTTHRNESARTGFEPDTCFYVRNLDYRFPEGPILPPRDPAPDLVIEVDISRTSLNKMKAYAAVGVREGWRYYDGRISIYTLAPGEVRQAETSDILPGVSAADLTMLLETSGQMRRIEWMPYVREWARARRTS